MHVPPAANELNHCRHLMLYVQQTEGLWSHMIVLVIPTMMYHTCSSLTRRMENKQSGSLSHHLGIVQIPLEGLSSIIDRSGIWGITSSGECVSWIYLYSCIALSLVSTQLKWVEDVRYLPSLLFIESPERLDYRIAKTVPCRLVSIAHGLICVEIFPQHLREWTFTRRNHTVVNMLWYCLLMCFVNEGQTTLLTPNFRRQRQWLWPCQ